ncbi:nucleotidyl transferase AbiEii/AbiGii toxin family protein [Ramlibacter agri]|uniref:nucleotidyl transferase AbiEii/AbiGii toxin family protein n=1 Tax=Ramlibacter agri TaxID=2728837 RepID=UPI00315B247D
MAKHANLTRPGAWTGLFEAALTLTDHLATVLEEPVWTFGGGTVLMLRINHRHSRDIDLFVPDPHYRGTQAQARDLFDLCAVADLDPASIDQAAPFFVRNGDAFIARLKGNAEYLEEEFIHIQRIDYKRPFEECLALAETVIAFASRR